MDFQHQKDLIDSGMKRLGVLDAHVLEAIHRVHREKFVPRLFRELAYIDGPLPIGQGQTISQPSLVAYMTQQLSILPHHRVLEIGTGSGYQTAILAHLAREVYTIEIIEQLSFDAEKNLQEYNNIHFQIGDGHLGWKSQAPFDRILVTAAAKKIPTALMDQLIVDGIMVIPVAVDGYQKLLRVHKSPEAVDIERLLDVRFVDMVSSKSLAKSF